jgi:hypothetical protein
MTGGARVSAGKVAGRHTDSALADVGPGLDFGTRPKVTPRPFSYFLYFFSFLFSDFYFISYLLQKCIKSIETSFRNFLKNCSKPVISQVFKIKDVFQ